MATGSSDDPVVDQADGSVPETFIFCSNHMADCRVDRPHTVTECRYRQIICEQCGDKIPLYYKSYHISNMCRLNTKECENRCENGCSLLGLDMKDQKLHFSVCPKNSCPYHLYGCRFRGAKSDVVKHLTNNNHEHELLLKPLTDSMQHLKTDLNGKTEEMQKFKKTLETLISSNKNLLRNIASQRDRIIQLERTVEESESKTVVENESRAIEETKQNLSHLQIVLQQVGDSASSRQPEMTAEQLSASAENITRELALHSRQLEVSDRRLEELGRRAGILETTSFNGVLIWKITNYIRRKRDAIDENILSLYSQPFYTSPNGYKLCARVYVNGFGMGKGSHLSLFLSVLRGECDNILSWPFQQRVTLMLLDVDTNTRHLTETFNTDPTSNSSQKPTTYSNIAAGCPMFVPHSVLETKTYLKDDTMFIKVIVSTPSSSQPITRRGN